MEDERGRLLNEYIDYVNRNAIALQEQVHNFMQHNQQNENFMISFENAFEKIAAQEKYQPLETLFLDSSSTSKSIRENTHEVMCSRPEKKLIALLTQIQNEAVLPVKKLLEDRLEVVRIEKKRLKEYEAQGKPKDKERKQRLYFDQKRRVANINSLVEYHIQKMEQYRVLRIKKVMQELSWSKMLYHCKELESISALNKQAGVIDIKDAVEDLRKLFRD